MDDLSPFAKPSDGRNQSHVPGVLPPSFSLPRAATAPAPALPGMTPTSNFAGNTSVPGGTAMTSDPAIVQQIIAAVSSNGALEMKQSQQMTGAIERDFKEMNATISSMTATFSDEVQKMTDAIMNSTNQVADSNKKIAASQQGQKSSAAPVMTRIPNPSPEPPDVDSTFAPGGGTVKGPKQTKLEKMSEIAQIEQAEQGRPGRHAPADQAIPRASADQYDKPYTDANKELLDYNQAGRDEVTGSDAAIGPNEDHRLLLTGKARQQATQHKLQPFGIDPHQGFSINGARGVAQKAYDYLERPGGKLDKYGLDPQHTGFGKKWYNMDEADKAGGDLTKIAPAGRLESAKLGMMNRVGTNLGKFAGGEGIAALGAGEAAPIVGGAILATQQVGHFLEDQRAKNQVYQQISGGSNLSAIGQRVHEKMFGLSMFGTMGGEEASQLYQGIAKTGATGARQNNALDFAVHNFKKTGMDIGTSLKLITDSIQAGIGNFDQLQVSLDSVSKSARNAGVNVGEAQKSFAAINLDVQQNVTRAPSGSRIAAGMQKTIDEMGHSVGLKPQDIAGMTSENSQNMQAAALGMPLETYKARISGGDTKLLGRGMNAVMAQGMQMNGMQGITAAEQAAAKHQPGHKLTNEQMTSIVEKARESGSFNADAEIAILKQEGINATPANIDALTGRIAAGQFNPAKAMEESGPKGLKAGGTYFEGHKIATSQHDPKHQWEKERSEVAKKFGHPDVRNPDTSQIEKGSGYNAMSDEEKQYFKMVYGSDKQKGTGVRNALAENVLTHEDTYKGDRFDVKTKGGKMKSVDYQTLFSQYKDQLKSGSVIDESKGATLSQLTGVDGVKGTKVTSDKKKAPDGAQNPQRHQKTGAVVISATPELNKWFKLHGTGDVSIPQRSGVPNGPFPPDPGGYPNASGPGN